MSTTTELEQHAKFLRNAAPREFDSFCAAFANYNQSMTRVMIHATGDLLVAQGRAQQCLKILQMLEGVKNGGSYG